jgi:uncharacterized damage-inducible protein DinB
MAPTRWLEPGAGGWTNKDLLGHLTAWSELLMDQVTALQQERPESIDAVDVDAWNADQVARRRSSTVEETIAAWRQAVQRADDAIRNLPPEIRARRWRVAWAAQPVCMDDLLGLWLLHLGQHRSRMAGPFAQDGADRTRGQS